MATSNDSPIRHPLEPLSAAEIEKAIALVRAEDRLSARARFALVWLSEPPKELVPPIDYLALLDLADSESVPGRAVELLEPDLTDAAGSFALVGTLIEHLDQPDL